MASLWELFVAISGDNSGFKQSLRDSQQDLGSFADFAETAGKRIATALSFAAVTKAVFDATQQFQDAANAIQRSTGAMGEDLQKLTTSMRNLFGSSVASESSIGAALSEITIKTGVTGQALESLTSTFLNFAKVTGQDVNTAVGDNQKLFAAWNISAADQAIALDLLVAGWQHAGGSATQFTGTLLALTTTLKTVGFSFEESVALVSNFTRVGLDADALVRGLTQAMGKWAEAGQDPRQQLQALIDQMTKAKTETDALALATEAGLGRSAKVMVQAVKDGAFQLDAMKAKLEESRGKTDELAKSTTSLGAEIIKTWHGVQNLAQAIGDPLVQGLTKAIGGVRSLNDEFAKYEKLFLGILDATTKTSYGASVRGAFGVINNALNPFAAGNYLNNYFGTPAPPSAPAPPPGPNLLPRSLTSGVPTANSGLTAPLLADTGLKGFPFKDRSQDAALWVEEMSLATQANANFVKSMAETNAPTAAQAKDVLDLAAAMKVDLADHAIAPTLDQMTALNSTMDKSSEGITKFLAKLPTAGSNIENAFKTLGIQSPAEFKQQGDDFAAAFKTIQDAGLGAWLQIGDAQERTTQEASVLAKELGQDATHLFSSVEDSLATDLIHWKGWGKSIMDIVDDIGKSLIKTFAQSALAGPQASVTGFARELGGSINRLFGGQQSTGEMGPKVLAALTANTTATTANSVSTTANTGATAADTTATVTNAASTIAAVVANTVATAADTVTTSVTSSVEFGAETANTAALIANTAAQAAGGASDILGGILGVGLGIFGFAGGGVVHRDMMAKVHQNEMILPPDIAVPLRASLSSGGQIGTASGGGVHFHNCNFGQSSMSDVVRQLRQAGARI